MKQVGASETSRVNGVKTENARRLLAERIASSRYLNRSARLRDLLLYLSDRVLEGEAGEIHEQEVGHKVFGRPLNYDTGGDNIVRVHASLLRKRLEQYFAVEGAAEPLILEIPKGNYAPVFRQREEPEREAPVLPPPPLPTRTDWRVWLLAGAAALFACSTAYLLLSRAQPSAGPPTVSLLWSRIFRPGQPTDIVLDDASLGLYQDLAGRTLSLSDYFARDYLRTLSETGVAGKLDPQTAHSIILKRYSSYAGANLLWKLFQMSGAGQPRTSVHFARDYTFRDLKANNVVLLGNSRSNPWIEPFESHLGLRWVYDNALGVQYPVDTWSGSDDKRLYRPSETGEAREGYCLIALLPNLGGNGNVLVISGTGGSTTNAAADFLADEQFVAQLRQRLPAAKDSRFPYFEVLLRVKGRSPLAHDTAVVVCRPPRV
jgi:hypothetical protein